MKVLKKVLKIIMIIAVSIVLLICLADAAWIYIPQIKAARKVEDVADYQKKISDITIPTGTRIVALGEASHGNAEFQELKLTVFQQLVEKNDIRAFALEADYGDGVLVNQYIHSEGSCNSAEEAVANLSFRIYQTDQMAELVSWMKQYNDTAAEEDQLSFYGFDIQNPEANNSLVEDFCTRVGLEADLSDVKGIYEKLSGSPEVYGVEPDYESVLVSCKGLIYTQEMEAIDSTNFIEASNFRDAAMADMVGEILAIEESKGHEGIMISGHDGHVSRQGLYYKSMGESLGEKYADTYFVIGTDYYKTTCNINNSDKDVRGNYKFCSADPLAYQAKYYDGQYYLAFADVQEGATKDLIEGTINTGSLGEAYTTLMKFFPTSHRVATKLQNNYDAMIFIYKATPTNPK